MLNELVLWLLGFGGAVLVALITYLLSSINRAIHEVKLSVDSVCKRLYAMDGRISAVDRRVAYMEGRGRQNIPVDYELRSEK